MLSPASRRKPFQALIFDLDDTLLDTSVQIVPKAMNEACRAMISAGLKTNLQACTSSRSQILKENPRTLVFDEILSTYGTSGDQVATINAGKNAFYKHSINEEIKISGIVRSLLADLMVHHDLFLVTSGDPNSQRQKVEKLGIGSFFRQLYFVNSLEGENKRDAFFEILQTTGVDPRRVLSVGNRIDNEIAASKSLDCATCLVLKGEYTKMVPESGFEVPDYTIQDLQELRAICQI